MTNPRRPPADMDMEEPYYIEALDVWIDAAAVRRGRDKLTAGEGVSIEILLLALVSK